MTMSVSKDTIIHKFPRTRYQGSKYKLLNWIKDSLNGLEYNTVLDAFGGTSSVAYMFKDIGKEVTFNDIMKFNHIIGKALIENQEILLEDNDLDYVLNKQSNIDYDNFIHKTFHDIYYTDKENEWLDIITQNIHSIQCEYKQAMLFWALFQSCIIKRPYNLFHRKNLYLRMSDVKRSFGNKKTWDKPFEDHFKKFVKEINDSIFNNNKENISINKDIFDISNNYDLVYIDTPYIPKKGSITTYGDFYHFLNGLVEYKNWNEKIDYSTKNLKLKSIYSIWEDKKNILSGFSDLLENFKDSILVISYRFDGIPSINEIKGILQEQGKTVEIKEIDYKYALSKTNLKEILIIAK